MNMEPKNHPFERKIIFQTSIIVFHVNLPGCKDTETTSKGQMLWASTMGSVKWTIFPTAWNCPVLESWKAPKMKPDQNKNM